MSESQALKILIVGAGIGGLTAAIALRQQGHDVVLLESSKFSHETGAAIHVCPNANGLLRRFGLFLEDIGGNEMTHLSNFDGRTGERTSHEDLRERNKKWQHPWHLVHRAHLHTALKEMAVSEQGKGRPAKLRLSNRVLRVDAHKAEVTVEGGEVFTGDLVLGADGVHSICRQSLDLQEEYKPYDSGHNAFRFLVPKKDLAEEDQFKIYVEQTGLLSMSVENDHRVIIYPCVDNTLMNFVFIHPSSESSSSESSSSWSQEGNKKLMLEIASNFTPDMRSLLDTAPEEELKLWTLLDLKVLPTWINGRLALLGDAAHPFLPHQGQGGAQAMEDAVSLAALLPLGTRRDEITDRLHLYMRCRKERADCVQDHTRKSGMRPDQLAELDQDFDAMSFIDYNFGHDEWDFSSQALEKHLQRKNQAS